MALIGGTDVPRIARPTVFARLADAASIVIVLLALPVGILIVGAPIAFLIGAAVSLVQRFLG
jgi:putative flippase GtrA